MALGGRFMVFVTFEKIKEFQGKNKSGMEIIFCASAKN